MGLKAQGLGFQGLGFQGSAWPGMDERNDECIITVSPENKRAIAVFYFDTDNGDVIYVNGVAYGGPEITDGPVSGIVPTEDITWYADARLQRV